MATGRSNQLTKQLGEYLVACELARRGFVVATFSGNIPDFDLIATDFKGTSYHPGENDERRRMAVFTQQVTGRDCGLTARGAGSTITAVGKIGCHCEDNFRQRSQATLQHVLFYLM